MTMNATGVYFKHFNFKHTEANQKMPCFTLAYRFLGTAMEIAVARCSEGDTFVKSKGRDIALDRLMNGHCITVIPPRDQEGRLFGFQNFCHELLARNKITYQDRQGNRSHMRYE